MAKVIVHPTIVCGEKVLVGVPTRGGGGLLETHRPLTNFCIDFTLSFKLKDDFLDMSSRVKVWRGERVLVGEEVKAATVVVQGDTIKNVMPGVVEVPG